jgi:hypothetical protein
VRGLVPGVIAAALREEEARPACAPAERFVPLKVPDGAAGTHFFIALAIVAGFSERWARGVLTGTEERIQSTTAPKAQAPAELKMSGSTGGP